MSTKQNALRMIRGKGDDAVTRYSCGVVEQAKEDGVSVLVMRRLKSGKMAERATEPRMVHRPDLLGSFADSHESAGEGKYINHAAFSQGNQQRVVGAQHVNPYLRDDGAYATIIEAFKKSIGAKRLSQLTARVGQSREAGTHLLWEGRRNADGFCMGAESAWMTAEEIWELAVKLKPDLLRVLRKSRSGRRGVKTHKSAKEKFFGDLDVLRRATCVVDVSTGEREYRGGATPYSKPLEQVGFAIDKRFLTYEVDADGNELGQYYYRMVIGRAEPHSLPRVSWAYEGIASKVAFKDEGARRKVRAIAA